MLRHARLIASQCIGYWVSSPPVPLSVPERGNERWTSQDRRHLLGLKFRRQHVLHGFIVDFCCLTERIVIEVVGDVSRRHLENVVRQVIGTDRWFPLS